LTRRIYALERDNAHLYTAFKAVEAELAREDPLFFVSEEEDSRGSFKVQSADVDNTPTVTDQKELVEFADAPQDSEEGMPMPTSSIDLNLDSDYADLARFLARPVRIESYDLALGETSADSFRTFKPWLLFFQNTSIQAKLDNFAYVQGDMKIKAVVNASPFIYGEYWITTQPLWLNFGEQFRFTTMTGNDRVPLSQRPHIVIQPHKNMGGTMTIPSINYRDWIATNNNSLNEFNQCQLFAMAPLQSANGLAAGPVTVNIYAWMENVRLAGNTSKFAVQSKDEYGQGPVSRIATAVSGVASTLEKVPVIGPFAKATSLGADIIGGIAGLFGFTNVPVIEDSKPLKNVPFHAFASSEIGVPVDKLTLDPKNELSIDPTIANAEGKDELALANFTSRRSFIVDQDWDGTDAINTNLITGRVTPTMCKPLVVSGVTQWYDTPMGLAARLFSNWRGDLIYTIKVVKSQYHQGRLGIYYDPTNQALASSSPESVVNTYIMDISTEDEVRIRVPYMAPAQFLRVEPDVTDNIYNQNGSALSRPYNHDYDNGYIRINVLNRLTGPDATAQVKILVFVEAAENFELANPSDPAFHSSIFEVQSSDVKEVTLGVSHPVPSNTYLAHFGERVRSLRSVMRRDTFHGAAKFTNSGTYAENGANYYVTRYERNIYPCYYGFDPNGEHTASDIVGVGTSPANFFRDPISNYVTPCFIGVRGSYNYSINPLFSEGNTSLAVMRKNEPISGALANDVVHSNSRQVDNDFRFTGVAGYALTNADTMSSLQVSVPFMNRFRFIDTSPSKRLRGTEHDDSENNNYIVQTRSAVKGTASSPYTLTNSWEIYASIGVDYTPVGFVNVPMRWKYQITPV